MTQDLHALTRLLRRVELRRGSNVVRQVETLAEAPLPTGCQAFEFRTKTLFGEARENLVVCFYDRDSIKQLLEFIEKIDNIRSADARCEIVFAAALKDEIEANAGHGREGLLFGAQAAFANIFRVSEEFPRHLIEKTEAEFDRIGFEHHFQERRARILQTPTGNLEGTAKRTAIVNLQDYMQKWGRVSPAPPMILLGDRGSGKTWQLLQFCVDQHKARTKNPMKHALAVYYPLHELRKHFNESAISLPSFSTLCMHQYGRDSAPSISTLWDSKFVDVLMDEGYIISCLDGLDELIEQATDDVVEQHLWRLISSLSPDSKFVITSRSAHFKSIEKLLYQEIWGRRKLIDYFQVMEMLPFDEKAISRYVCARRYDGFNAKGTALKAGGALIQEILDAVCDIDSAIRPQFINLFTSVAELPAALAWLLQRAERNLAKRSGPAHILNQALLDVTIGFNLDTGRASENFIEGFNVIGFDADTRRRVLEELALVLADDGLDVFSPALLSASLAVRLGITSNNALERDMRSQTVLELAQKSEEPNVADMREDLRFGFRTHIENEAAHRVALSAIGDDEGHLLRHGEVGGLERESLKRSPVCVTSVAGAFFAASWVARRLNDMECFRRAYGWADGEEWLSPLGRFPLGPAAGVILYDLLREEHGGAFISALRERCIRALINLARRRGYKVFSPRVRHLGHNLQAMTLISEAERQSLDPWFGGLGAIERGPDGKRMVLVPPPDSARIQERCQHFGSASERRGGSGRREPFLMSVTEVTNEDFFRFVSSETGAKWRVENVTVAGSALSGSGKWGSNPLRHFTNEYHLYHWEAGDTWKGAHGELNEPLYRPAHGCRDHPVTYVSWYAAAKYCDWISEADRRPETYPDILTPGGAFRWMEKDRFRTVGGHGYRLPFAEEWWWTAQAGFDDVEYPWQLYPFHIPSNCDIETLSTQRGSENMPKGLLGNFVCQRENMKKLLVEQARSTTSVASGEFPTFGVLGMVGNVKEWCAERVARTSEDGMLEHVILGASSYLGDSSFAFGYWMSLFPQNTNPDVGFRIARSLNKDELTVLLKREAEIGKI